MSGVLLITNATAIALGGVTLPFSVSGGTGPYTFSVVTGGAGGTIDSDGLYTSPSVRGTDIIKVTDSQSASAKFRLLVGNALDLFCDVIRSEMGMANDQVYLWDQKINIPTDLRPYVAIGVVSCKPYGNSNRANDDGDQVQSTNFYSLLSVDIFSRGSAARDRKEELILALNSNYAQRQQELNSFYIATLSTNIINLSEIDGAAIPYRFTLNVAIQYAVTKVSGAPYYDTFESVSVVGAS